jgi:hypothetical protein
MANRIPTFAEFWPFYLSQHRNALNRRLHFVGTTGTNLAILSALVTGRLWMLLLAPLSGYAFAWVGHFIIEKNRPATFTYPLWSLAGDYKMYGLTLIGKLGPELARAGVTTPGNAAPASAS